MFNYLKIVLKFIRLNNQTCSIQPCLFICIHDYLFIRHLFLCSPVKNTVVINDRWGNDARCRHGGFMTCDDRYNPGMFCFLIIHFSLDFEAYVQNLISALFVSVFLYFI